MAEHQVTLTPEFGEFSEEGKYPDIESIKQKLQSNRKIAQTSASQVARMRDKRDHLGDQTGRTVNGKPTPTTVESVNAGIDPLLGRINSAIENSRFHEDEVFVDDTVAQNGRELQRLRNDPAAMESIKDLIDKYRNMKLL